MFNFNICSDKNFFLRKKIKHVLNLKTKWEFLLWLSGNKPSCIHEDVG